MLLSSSGINQIFLTSAYLFLVFVPVHCPALKEGPCSHVRGHRLLECLINVTRWGLVLPDTFKPFPHVKMSCVVALAADIGIEQSALCKVEFGG